MIAVVATVRGEIESDGEAFLTRREIAAVEGIGIFGGGEAGILPDRPWLRRVHRGVGAAKVRRLARIGVEKVEAGEVSFAVDRADGDTFRRRPRGRRAVAWRHRRIGEIDRGEVGDLTHLTPRIPCTACRVESASQPI